MGLNDVSDDLGEEGMTMFDFNILQSLRPSVDGSYFQKTKTTRLSNLSNTWWSKYKKKYKIRRKIRIQKRQIAKSLPLLLLLV